MITKKLLVPYSDEIGPAKGRTFIAPVWDGRGGVRYVPLPGTKPVEKGMNAFAGTEITVAEFMVRLVDHGFKILPSYDWQKNVVERYLETVKQIKVGHIVRLIPKPDGSIRFESDATAIPGRWPTLPLLHKECPDALPGWKVAHQSSISSSPSEITYSRSS